jgi:hypothetical protein
MQHFLNFLPLPQGQGSFRPTPLRPGKITAHFSEGLSARFFSPASDFPEPRLRPGTGWRRKGPYGRRNTTNKRKTSWKKTCVILLPPGGGCFR